MLVFGQAKVSNKFDMPDVGQILKKAYGMASKILLVWWIGSKE